VSSSFVTDPVIVVLPSAQGWLSDGSYTAFASQGGALIEGPGIAREAVGRDPTLERFVRGATPVAGEAARLLSEQLGRLRMAVLTALASCVVLVVTSIAGAITHARHSAQRMFVRHLNGWRPVTAHRGILTVEISMIVTLAAWICWRAELRRREVDALHATAAPLPIGSPQLDPWLVASSVFLALVAIGAFLIALAAARRAALRRERLAA
jgi:hypothetical protein